ncbi:hypothetical protein CH63R_07002 [Colletotrichum higginsianum IMI 349063]|uniref:Uncharacterized protein n=1 Tax=Colletotrichum higginsianum (strain IMI 349063) TaxID=759273 RepID=A0A1B7Y8A3_COLHI|nr:hypothetical protein CH63R_07002 [Colletotrichum higginsianum IMI 349063]OBR08237.1 hypothetical protein CH63R_07002 [Colletotrichum higginsianum IMI 349063]
MVDEPNHRILALESGEAWPGPSPTPVRLRRQRTSLGRPAATDFDPTAGSGLGLLGYGYDILKSPPMHPGRSPSDAQLFAFSACGVELLCHDDWPFLETPQIRGSPPPNRRNVRTRQEAPPSSAGEQSDQAIERSGQSEPKWLVTCQLQAKDQPPDSSSSLQ